MSDSRPLPVEEVGEGGLDVPPRPVHDVAGLEPAKGLGATSYRHEFSNGLPLDALLVNAGSNVLVVSFHGALNRAAYSLPRYERLSTLLRTRYSSMYLGDPALHLTTDLQLSWYAGWKGCDLYPILASWTTRAAQAIGASTIVYSGSSGGGFAALQTSALVPGSVALVFNPQTAIASYLSEGTSRGAQRIFVDSVMPELAPDGFAALPHDEDWSLPLGDRLSALRRYARPVENSVYYAQNPNDFHHDHHYVPFLTAAAKGDNLGRVKVHEYDGRDGHAPPVPEVFTEALEGAVSWSGAMGR